MASITLHLPDNAPVNLTVRAIIEGLATAGMETYKPVTRGWQGTELYFRWNLNGDSDQAAAARNLELSSILNRLVRRPVESGPTAGNPSYETIPFSPTATDAPFRSA